VLEFIADQPQDPGERLDRFLHGRLPEHSRARLQSLIRDGHALLNGKPSKPGAALKAGEVDAIFGDNLQVIYWVAGEAAANCCRLLDGAYSDFDYFSRNLAFLVRPERPELRAAFDYGLDQAQSSGATAKIIRTYVPLPPW